MSEKIDNVYVDAGSLPSDKVREVIALLEQSCADCDFELSNACNKSSCSIDKALTILQDIIL